MINAVSNHARSDQSPNLRDEAVARGARSLALEPRSVRPASARHEVRELAPASLDEVVVAAQIEERRRLAGELHDALGQKMVALSLGLGRLRRDAGFPADLRPILEEMGETLQQAHSEIRTVAFLLQPPEGKDIETSLHELATGFAQRAGLAAEVRIGRLNRPLCDGRKLTLFRILQEALVNVHRHASASTVFVELTHKRGSVVLSVRDDGRGLWAPGEAPFREGVGLANMRARLRRFGGDLSLTSDDKGVALTARMPN